MLNEFSGKTTILFVSTCSTAQCLTYMLRNLGFKAVCLHGQMPQPKRLSALSKFKEGSRNILIATDVASSGRGGRGHGHQLRLPDQRQGLHPPRGKNGACGTVGLCVQLHHTVRMRGLGEA